MDVNDKDGDNDGERDKYHNEEQVFADQWDHLETEKKRDEIKKKSQGITKIIQMYPCIKCIPTAADFKAILIIVRYFTVNGYSYSLLHVHSFLHCIVG